MGMKGINTEDHVLCLHLPQDGVCSPSLTTLAVKHQHDSNRKFPESCILHSNQPTCFSNWRDPMNGSQYPKLSNNKQSKCPQSKRDTPTQLSRPAKKNCSEGRNSTIGVHEIKLAKKSKRTTRSTTRNP